MFFPPSSRSTSPVRWLMYLGCPQFRIKYRDPMQFWPSILGRVICKGFLVENTREFKKISKSQQKGTDNTKQSLISRTICLDTKYLHEISHHFAWTIWMPDVPVPVQKPHSHHWLWELGSARPWHPREWRRWRWRRVCPSEAVRPRKWWNLSFVQLSWEKNWTVLWQQSLGQFLDPWSEVLNFRVTRLQCCSQRLTWLEFHANDIRVLY